MIPRPPRSTLFPYTTLFRSGRRVIPRPGREELHELAASWGFTVSARSEEHTSELQSLRHLVCRLLLEKRKVKHEVSSEVKPTRTATGRGIQHMNIKVTGAQD